MEMDFESMKRRELQALCKRHGLSAGGSNAALVARLAATLSVRTPTHPPIQPSCPRFRSRVLVSWSG